MTQNLPSLYVKFLVITPTEAKKTQKETYLVVEKEKCVFINNFSSINWLCKKTKYIKIKQTKIYKKHNIKILRKKIMCVSVMKLCEIVEL